MDQERIFEVFTLKTSPTRPKQHEKEHLPFRPMSNLLSPCGVPKRDWARASSVRRHSTTRDQGPTKITGRVGKFPLLHPDGCMGDSMDFWTDSDRGVRRLQVEELAKGKGLPSEWRDKAKLLPKETVAKATSLHLWMTVCDSVATWLREERQSDDAPLDTTKRNTGSVPSPTVTSTDPPSSTDQMHWSILDLSGGSEFHRAQVSKLREVLLDYPDQNRNQLCREG